MMGVFPDHLLQHDEMTQRYFRLVSAWKATDRRVELGISQTDLGRVMGITRGVLATWERAGFPLYVTEQQVSALEAFLKTERGWLFRDESPNDMTLDEYVLVVMAERRERAALDASFLIAVPESMRVSAVQRAMLRRQHLKLARGTVEEQMAVGSDTLQYWETNRLPASIDRRVIERWEKALQVPSGWLISDAPMPDGMPIVSRRRMLSPVDVAPESFAEGVRLARRICTRRHQIGMSAAKLARAIDIDFPDRAVTYWESGASIPEIDDTLIRHIETALLLPEGWLRGSDPLPDLPQTVVSAGSFHVPDEIRIRAGVRLRERRLELGLSQLALGKLIDFGPAAISAWEVHGIPRATWKPALILTIEQALQVAPGWLTDAYAQEGVPFDRTVAYITSRISLRRKQLGVTADLLSSHLGLPPHRVLRWDFGRGVNVFDAELLRKLERLLSLPEGWLCSDEPLPDFDPVTRLPDGRILLSQNQRSAVCSRIMARRVQLGVSRLLMSGRIGISEDSLRCWEVLDRFPMRCDADLPARIEGALLVPAGWLLGDDPLPLDTPKIVGSARDTAFPKCKRRLAAHRLMVRRTEIGLSRQDIASVLGLNAGTLRSWETRDGLPLRCRQVVVDQIERLLNVRSGWLFSDDAEPKTYPELEPRGELILLPEDVQESAGHRIKARRAEIGLERRSLADSVGVTLNTVRLWEEKSLMFPRRCRVSMMRQLEAALQVEEGWLLG
ncbi:hypothetical protein A9R05_42765 (plasmid) [Burkholderia sp. KK1]|uniref:HTH cro/C1-type domain-containing protein n=1 Tax=Burkholderia sp. M701 TaxID=326454 RepID=V5YPY5_9BURK|nr:helix-turn-helix transcriptional regulator [Burkholderia sp. M701]AQH05742.1 hypothetical protein A9R05_42765 [Burkholderia sp. KK1]BAO18976.1 hypothetical protein [Burkholderia sp. M701]